MIGVFVLRPFLVSNGQLMIFLLLKAAGVLVLPISFLKQAPEERDDGSECVRHTESENRDEFSRLSFLVENGDHDEREHAQQGKTQVSQDHPPRHFPEVLSHNGFSF